MRYNSAVKGIGYMLGFAGALAAPLLSSGCSKSGGGGGKKADADKGTLELVISPAQPVINRPVTFTGNFDFVDSTLRDGSAENADVPLDGTHTYTEPAFETATANFTDSAGNVTSTAQTFGVAESIVYGGMTNSVEDSSGFRPVNDLRNISSQLSTDLRDAINEGILHIAHYGTVSYKLDEDNNVIVYEVLHNFDKKIPNATRTRAAGDSRVDSYRFQVITASDMAALMHELGL